MWPTVDGLRILADEEADLVRRSIGVMLDHLVAEREGQFEAFVYGIEWFDQWDRNQRIWLLQQVTQALLTDSSAPSPAAMYEATVDAIFHQIIELVSDELEDHTFPVKSSWRQRVINAFRSQSQQPAEINAGETDLQRWQTVITQIADAILGLRLYQKAESFRDREMQQTQKFLLTKGLPDDFLQQIPPLRTTKQTQESIKRIQDLIVH